jgi:hypothetical protein
MLSKITSFNPSFENAAMKARSAASITRNLDIRGKSEILELMHNLQTVLTAIETLELTTPNRQTISDAIYSAEYRLFRIQHEPGRHSLMVSLLADITESLRLAAHLFLHLAIRELPVYCNMHQKMSERLRSSLSTTLRSKFDEKIADSRPLLLWVAFIGRASSPDQNTKLFFWRCFRDIAEAHRVQRREEIECILRGILWNERFCAKNFNDLWNEMNGLVSVPSVMEGK